MQGDKICEACGRKLSDFYKTGMLGCPKCYEAFKGELNQVILKIQGKDKHVGKKGVDSVIKELLSLKQRIIAEKSVAMREKRFLDVANLELELSEVKEELALRGIE